jgi:hypothetical protein
VQNDISSRHICEYVSWSRCLFNDAPRIHCLYIPSNGAIIRRWVDNIRMYLGKVGWGDVDWIGLAQDRNRWRALVNSVLNLRVP